MKKYDILGIMTGYARLLDEALSTHFSRYREVLVLLGARQVGKTTIIQKLFPDALYLSVDNESVRANLDRYDSSVYRQLLSDQAKQVIIDELHLLHDPGRAAKIIRDQMPDIQLIITGSSSFSIKNRTSESLAGRKIDYHLYPLAYTEYLVQQGIENTLSYQTMQFLLEKNAVPEERIHAFDQVGILRNILIYGLYPGMMQHPQDGIYLKNLIDSAIFKDILDLSLVESRSAALSLLRLVAYQTGSLVNMTELATRLGLNIKTVKRYLTIFEQSFIIFPLYPYAKSGRDEIGKMPKIYFYDTGIRNALIDNFQVPETRNDMGQLFENFVVSELYKLNTYGNYGISFHYWRTRQGSEIDLVLSRGDTLFGIEIKYQSGKISRAFQDRYPQATCNLLTAKNFY
ncbi:TPA: hypothetical protein DIS60_03685 [Patescibacteria group bacterium]|nr:hypothetical protein [Patescibacteria group bacterium]